MWDHLFCWPLLPHHTMSSPPWLPTCASPTHLDEYGSIKCLVVRLLNSSIFWQFWVFFVLMLVVILLMVVQGRRACLPTPPSWLEVPHVLNLYYTVCSSTSLHWALLFIFVALYPHLPIYTSYFIFLPGIYSINFSYFWCFLPASLHSNIKSMRACICLIHCYICMQTQWINEVFSI